MCIGNEECRAGLVQKNLRLSEKQVADLLQQRRAFLEQIGSLLQERKRIQASMKVLTIVFTSLPGLHLSSRIHLSVTTPVHQP